MLLLQSKKLHLIIGLPTAILTAVLVAWYIADSMAAGHWLSGGSFPGIVCGIAAGLIIVFEMCLSPRKWFRRVKILLPAKYWMAAHLWLGLASLPLAIAHCGMVLGGWLPATFMILFILTIISGIYGWIVQNILPKWMLRNLPSETIYGQIDHVSEVTVEDAKSLLVACCGGRATGDFAVDHQAELAETGPIVVGAQREVGRTIGRTAETRKIQKSEKDNDLLWNAFDKMEPFLKEGKKAATPVTEPPRAALWFDRLRSECGSESRETIDILEQMCNQRRQFDTQRTAHRILHAWLPVHIGLSVAVLGLLVAHIWTALMYW